MKSNLRWLSALITVLAISPLVTRYVGPYHVQIILLCGINIILATSLNLVNGFTGQFSMGHAGFMSVGAYVSAFITTVLFPQFFMGEWGAWMFVIPLLAGASVSAFMGYLVGLPSLRLKGDYLAIVTLGFGEIIRVVLLNVQSVGGARGLPAIPALAGFSWIYSCVVISLFVLWRTVYSRFGRSFVAVREDEIAAESMGVNTTKIKVRAFLMGAFFSGLAGALFAHYLQYITPSVFDFNKSFEVIIMVVFGGMGSLSGSVIAAVFLTTLKEVLRELKDYTQVDLRMVIYSFLLIVLMLSRPSGLLGRYEILEFLKRLKFPKKKNNESR